MTSSPAFGVQVGLLASSTIRPQRISQHSRICRTMGEGQALSVFAALSQETRLRIVRLLILAGEDGLPAGTFAERMGAAASTMSFHLKEL